jgi:hypothetical protein
VVLGRKFRPPPANDVRQWEKVEYLVRHGFVFQTVHDDVGRPVRYPATLKQAQEFVRKHGHRVASAERGSGTQATA